ncbi:MAG TPA: hypothetical protein VMQ65_08490 [Candidatus Limnocylindria bacterium]|nr:hypothetical protein [Candidatus Limnocylindria bacterium]
MSRRPFRVESLAIIVALLLAGCDADQTPSTAVSTDPGTTRADATACEAATIEAQDFVPAEPEPLVRLRGAKDPGQEELNQEGPPPVPVDDAVDLAAIEESVFAPPRGAEGEERPEDALAYQLAPIPPHPISPQVEPEVAVAGDRVLMTWNFNAAVSDNGGASFRFLSPFTTFPDQADRFWGDQRAEYSAAHDLWLWVLMYKQDAAGSNFIRLGVAPGDSVFDGSRGTYYDWSPEATGFPGRVWFDQPKVATTSEHAYLSINAFGSDGTGFHGAIVIRMSLAALAAGADPQAQCFFPGTDATIGYPYFGPYLTRGAADTMYFAAHRNTSSLAVWRWRDSEDSVTVHTVQDRYRWPANGDYDDPARSDYTCRRAIRLADGSQGMSPDTSDWCLRLSDGRAKNDGRITSGWVAVSSREIGFAWNIASFDNPDTDTVDLPYPAVWVVTLNESQIDSCLQGECITGRPWLMDPGYAIQYAAIAPNARGDLGAVVLTGGGSTRHGGYLTCMAAIRDESSGGAWHFIDLAASDTDVPRPSSGDYLGVWPNGPASNTWSASCMTYEQGIGDRIHYARFGRRADIP